MKRQPKNYCAVCTHHERVHKKHVRACGIWGCKCSGFVANTLEVKA